ncbi:hypothetical protein OK016_28885 [Vibrio chagasii]|nr:hypothetical protein [Vibrio chagasii]
MGQAQFQSVVGQLNNTLRINRECRFRADTKGSFRLCWCNWSLDCRGSQRSVFTANIFRGSWVERRSQSRKERFEQAVADLDNLNSSLLRRSKQSLILLASHAFSASGSVISIKKPSNSDEFISFKSRKLNS